MVISRNFCWQRSGQGRTTSNFLPLRLPISPSKTITRSITCFQTPTILLVQLWCTFRLLTKRSKNKACQVWFMNGLTFVFSWCRNCDNYGSSPNHIKPVPYPVLHICRCPPRENKGTEKELDKPSYSRVSLQARGYWFLKQWKWTDAKRQWLVCWLATEVRYFRLPIRTSFHDRWSRGPKTLGTIKSNAQLTRIVLVLCCPRTQPRTTLQNCRWHM